MNILVMSFSDQINDVFKNYIENDTIRCDREQFIIGLNSIIENIQSKQNKHIRKKSNFMIWLNKERNNIKDEYFGDFESYDSWDEEGIRSYYVSKELPLEKLENLIEKKKSQNKTIGKPRLMSLITTKAGQIWSDMTCTEKDMFKTISSEEINNSTEPKYSNMKKKGRPKGTRPKTYLSDMAIINS